MVRQIADRCLIPRVGKRTRAEPNQSRGKDNARLCKSFVRTNYYVGDVHHLAASLAHLVSKLGWMSAEVRIGILKW